LFRDRLGNGLVACSDDERASGSVERKARPADLTVRGLEVHARSPVAATGAASATVARRTTAVSRNLGPAQACLREECAEAERQEDRNPC
jgi:hypothetical protein